MLECVPVLAAGVVGDAGECVDGVREVGPAVAGDPQQLAEARAELLVAHEGGGVGVVGVGTVEVADEGRGFWHRFRDGRKCSPKCCDAN